MSEAEEFKRKIDDMERDKNELIREASKTIEELLPRATPAAQKELLEKLQSGDADTIDESVEEELSVQ